MSGRRRMPAPGLNGGDIVVWTERKRNGARKSGDH
jgi:hypothetical protein